MRNIFYPALMLAALASCSNPDDSKDAPRREFVDVAGIDPAIKPGDDFFMHVNGKWYDTARIADDQVGVGSYSFMNIPQRALLENILEEVAAGTHPAGSNEQKVGDFYASGMDTEVINARGYQPIQPVLDAIELISDLPSMMHFVNDQIARGNNSLIGMNVSPDQENSQINILHFSQSGLGLPDRDYYFKTDSATLGIQQAYKTYIATLFELTGSSAKDAQKS